MLRGRFFALFVFLIGSTSTNGLDLDDFVFFGELHYNPKRRQYILLGLATTFQLADELFNIEAGDVVNMVDCRNQVESCHS